MLTFRIFTCEKQKHPMEEKHNLPRPSPFSFPCLKLTYFPQFHKKASTTHGFLKTWRLSRERISGNGYKTASTSTFPKQQQIQDIHLDSSFLSPGSMPLAQPRKQLIQCLVFLSPLQLILQGSQGIQHQIVGRDSSARCPPRKHYPFWVGNTILWGRLIFQGLFKWWNDNYFSYF